MTLIVACKENGKTFMGGDSMAASADEAWYVETPKVFQHGPFTYGYAGSFRFGQVLEYLFIEPDHDPKFTDMAYMVGVWFEILRETLETYGLMKCDQGVEEIGDGGNALIAYRDGLYILQQDMALLKVTDDFVAIGGGATYATGIMWALKQQGLPADEIVKKALEGGYKYFPRAGGTPTILEHSHAGIADEFSTPVAKTRKPRREK